MSTAFRSEDIALGTAAERFHALIEQIVEGRVVPLLGAGISMDVQFRDRDATASTQMMTERMREKLALDKRLTALAPATPNTDLEFNRAAELAHWFYGSVQTCDLLLLHELAHPSVPLLAHACIAVLAREGIIREVITTNYDCALEKAYRQTFKGRYAPGGRKWTAISGPHEYGFVAWDGRRGGSPLRLYKINGSAAELDRALKRAAASKQRAESKDAKPEDHRRARRAKRELGRVAERILLSERQLHHFGDRSWARDLVRDRIRSKQLLFNGFGSSEPQIRHVLMDVLEEFHAEGSRPLSRKAAAPRLWVVAHRDTIEFHVVEALLVEWWGRRQNRPNPGSPRWPRAETVGRIPMKVFDNMFAGSDCAYFGAEAEDRLDASVFWLAVFSESLRRRFDRETRWAHEFRRFLADVTSEHWRRITLVHARRIWLRVCNMAWTEAPHGEPPSVERVRVPEWLNFPPSRPGPAAFVDRGGRYLPATGNPELAVLVVLFAAALRGDDERKSFGDSAEVWVESDHPTGPLWLVWRRLGTHVQVRIAINAGGGMVSFVRSRVKRSPQAGVAYDLSLSATLRLELAFSVEPERAAAGLISAVRAFITGHTLMRARRSEESNRMSLFTAD